MDYSVITDARGTEGYVILVGWPIVHSLLTKVITVIRESLSAGDRRPNYWASPPLDKVGNQMMKFSLRAFCNMNDELLLSDLCSSVSTRLKDCKRKTDKTSQVCD